MKIPGMIRKVDPLGRIVIPAALRGRLNIQNGDLVEMTVEGDRLILGKFSSTCVFCGTNQQIVTFMDKPVCRSCIAKLKG